MTFSELPLYQAIADTFGAVDSPRSNGWLIDREKQRALYQSIVGFMTDFSNGVPWKDTDVMQAWENFGKSSTVDGIRKAQLIVEVSRVHGSKCFYANRGLGECDDEVELERIVPGARGGKYTLANCVIACRAHNNARRDTNVEEFLNSVA